MSRKSLREKQIPGSSVHVGHRSVPQRVQGIETIEPSSYLPVLEIAWTRRLEIRWPDWLQKRGESGSRPSPARLLYLQNLSSFGISASGRNTSAVRPPLAINHAQRDRDNLNGLFNSAQWSDEVKIVIRQMRGTLVTLTGFDQGNPVDHRRV